MRGVVLAAMLVAASLVLIGCSGDTYVHETGTATLVINRTDSMAYPVTDNWHEPTNVAINAVKARGVHDMRAFRAVDGAGILAWIEGDSKTFLFLAFYDTEGAIGPAVEIMGDFPDRHSVEIDSLVIVWTPSGDAVIAFIARQSDDPLVDNGEGYRRVYYTSFRRLFAELPVGPTGETYGFQTWARVVDTSIESVSWLFVASNLADGTLDWNDDDDGVLTEMATGSRGDNCLGNPFIFLGWRYDTTAAERLQGGFVGFDDLSLGEVMPIPVDPNMTNDDSLRGRIQTSGRDLAFDWMDFTQDGTAGNSVLDRITLLRVNDARTGFEAPIDVGRGPSMSDETRFEDWDMIGHGYRVLNGQDATWFLMKQDGFATETVTQDDDDLLIAQVDRAGEVQIGEYDANAPSAEEWNSLMYWDFHFCRGATRLFLYWTQPLTGNANPSLFARALRLNEQFTLAQNVSNFERINGRISTGSEDDGVRDFYLPWIDPFADPYPINDVSCVAFRQTFRMDTTAADWKLDYQYGEVRIADINAAQLSLASFELPIRQNLDYTDDTNIMQPPMVVIGPAECLVFFIVNGNNAENSSSPTYFEEPRPFAWASIREDDAPVGMTPLEIGTNNPFMPQLGFADFGAIDFSYPDDEIPWLIAGATPRQATPRDCTFNDEVLLPQIAHAIFWEFLRDPDGGKETAWRARAFDLTFDLQGENSVTQAIHPALTQAPFMIGTGYNGVQFNRLDGPYFDAATEGNDVLLVFNEVWGQAADPGFIYVNCFNPESFTWSRAALLSTDHPGPIGNHGHPDLLLVPGTGATDMIKGGWVFWIRSIVNVGGYYYGEGDGGEADADLLQGRRFFDTRLP